MFSPDKRVATLDKPEVFILVSGFAILLITIFIFNRPAFYDEDDYLRNVAIIHKFGFGKEYLLNLIGSAGPLYSTVHYLLEPVTHLAFPFTRLVNIAFLAGVTILIGLSLKLLKFSERKNGLIIMAIPMTYVISGLALTEMPAMFFLSSGIYLVIKSVTEKSTYSRSLFNALLAGICMSLAILGRQPYLLLLAALPILFPGKKNSLRNSSILIVTLLSSLALPCYIFWIWKGLVAPSDAAFYADIAGQGINYRPELLLLCLAYYAIVFILIAPEFYKVPTRKEMFILLTSAVMISVLNQKIDLIRFLPLKAIYIKILSSQHIDFAEKFAGSLLAVTGIYFMIIVFRRLRDTGFKKELLFYAVALLAIAISCIKLTHGFSSRYAAQAIPLLIPFSVYFNKNNPYSYLRLSIGVLTGSLSLVMYFIS